MIKYKQNKPGFGALICLLTAVMAFLAGKFMAWWAFFLFFIMALISWQMGMVRWGMLQNKIREQKMALERSRQYLALDRLKGLLTYSPNPMSIFDEQGRYVDVSEATARAAGTSKEGLRGKRFSEVWPRAVADEFMKTLGELLREKNLLSRRISYPQKTAALSLKHGFFR